MTPEQELDLRLSPPPNGSVIQIGVSFEDSPKTYTYVAVEAVGGWYLTNVRFDPPLTWDGLIDWFKSKDANVAYIRIATEWENHL